MNKQVNIFIMRKFQLLKRCPKTNRIIGIDSSSFTGRLIFPIVGILAILWFLFRVLPKPDRIAYPCQKVAMSIGGSFATYIAAIILSYPLFIKLRQMNKTSAYLSIFVLVIAGSTIGLFGITPNPETFDSVLTPTEGQNNPMGAERGIFPGRVTWVQNFDAASWNGEDGVWWSDENSNQAVIEDMLADVVKNIAGKGSVKSAWTQIFKHHNKTMNQSSKSYKKGEMVVIKVNLNAIHKPDNKWTDRGYPSPHVLNALVKQLIEEVGVQGKDIKIVDPSRYFVGPIYEKIRSNGGEYLDIEFIAAQSSTDLAFIKEAKPDTSNTIFFNMPNGSQYKMCLPMCYSQADYIIDCALVRPHRVFGVTNVAKNHFGSVWDFEAKAFKPNALHAFALWDYPEHNKHGDPHSSPVLLGHESIYKKTVLYMADGLYSGYNQVKEVRRFSTMDNNWLSSIFVSLDPVALESVCYDFVASEPNLYSRNPSFNGHQDSQMHECALANEPPSKTKYDPENDGEGLNSLGVHEHWNNNTDKQYSRNLGKSYGIELVALKK